MKFKLKLILIISIFIYSTLIVHSEYGSADDGDSILNPIVITKRVYKNVQVNSSSSKWYELPMNGRLIKDVSIAFNNSTANLDLYLWNSSSILNSSVSTGNSESLSYYVPTQNSYFVEIRNLDISSSGIFNLSILPDDDLELNNDFANATLSSSQYGMYFDYLILNDREMFNITFLNHAYVSIWVIWFGDFHHGTLELYGLGNSTLIDSKSYFGGFSTTRMTFTSIFNGTISIVINDDQADLGIYYSIRIDILYEDEFESNNNIATPSSIPLESSYDDPVTYFGKYMNLTMTDMDFYRFQIPSFLRSNNEEYTILIFVNYSSYIYGYVPSLSLTLYTSDQGQIERSLGEIDNHGIPFSKIYHRVDDSLYYIGISPIKTDYFVRYSLTIVIYKGPPAEDPWDAISLARPGEDPYGPGMAIPGFSIFFIVLSIIISTAIILATKVKLGKYFQKKR